MKPMRTQPYYSYAISKLPSDSRIENAVAEYLGMRLSKDIALSPKVWNACIDELVVALGLDVESDTKRKARKLQIAKEVATVADIIYMLEVATARKWNHIYFTRDQDIMWDNISYYQDPYWRKCVKGHKKEMMEVLNSERPGHAVYIL